jgi:hypothetical protein
VEEMGLGQLRLAPSILYDLTFEQFGNAMAGHYQEIEVQQKGEWERTRWLAAVVISPHTKKRIKPTDLIEFEWERRKKAAVDGFGILRQIAKRNG